jgi:hypothetical protein
VCDAWTGAVNVTFTQSNLDGYLVGWILGAGAPQGSRH